MSAHNWFKVAILGTSLLGFGAPALAQEFPAKPVRIVVANSAGSIADLAARLLGQEMTKFLGQPIIVEPKPGGNQLIALDHVMNSPADGYTTVITYVSPLASLPVQVKNLKFDPLKDLPPITTVFGIKAFLVTPINQPWTTFNQMVSYAKANPGKLNYGSNNLSIQMVIESVIRQFGLDIVHVPFSGAGPLIQAVVSNQIQLVITTEANIQTFKDAIRPVGVSGDKRVAKFPDLPLFKELGVAQIRDPEYTLNIRSETPRAALDKLHSAAVRALQTQALKDGFAKLAGEPVGDTQESAAKKLAEEAALYADIAKKMGVKPE